MPGAQVSVLSDTCWAPGFWRTLKLSCSSRLDLQAHFPICVVLNGRRFPQKTHLPTAARLPALLTWSSETR